MPNRRPAELEQQVMTVLLRAIAEDRLDVADHLLAALEVLGPRLSAAPLLALANRVDLRGQCRVRHPRRARARCAPPAHRRH